MVAGYSAQVRAGMRVGDWGGDGHGKTTMSEVKEWRLKPESRLLWFEDILGRKI